MSMQPGGVLVAYNASSQYRLGPQWPHRANALSGEHLCRGARHAFWPPVPLGWHRDVRSVVTVRRNGTLWRSGVSPAELRGDRTGPVGYDRY